MLTQIKAIDVALEQLKAQFGWLSGACDTYAFELTQAHAKICAAIAEFLEIAMMVGSFSWLFGGPIGAGRGVTLAAARGELAGTRIMFLIDELGAASAMGARPLIAIAGAGAGAFKDLIPLLEAKPTVFEANTRPGGRPPEPTKPYGEGSETNAGFNGEQGAQDLRHRLSNSGHTIKNGKNVGVAQAEIDGEFIPSSELQSVSGY